MYIFLFRGGSVHPEIEMFQFNLSAIIALFYSDAASSVLCIHILLKFLMKLGEI